MLVGRRPMREEMGVNAERTDGPPHRYRAHGLDVLSEVELPMLRKAPPRPIDGPLVIRRAKTPSRLEKPSVHGLAYQAEARRVLVSFEGIRIFVRDGEEVLVETEANADEDLLRNLLCTTAMAAILHQRRLLPMEAAAVERDGRVTLLLGHCASGKSTAAAMLCKRGFRLLSDDLTSISFVSGEPRVNAGRRTVTLWPDVLPSLGLDRRDGRPCRKGHEAGEFALPRADAPSPLPAERIVLLSTTNDGALKTIPVKGAKRFRAIAAATYLLPLAVAEGLEQRHFMDSVRLSSIGTTTSVRIPRFPIDAAAVADAIMNS